MLPGRQRRTWRAGGRRRGGTRAAGASRCARCTIPTRRGTCTPAETTSPPPRPPHAPTIPFVYGLRHSDHISDALISLHWLRAQERVRFKTAVLMYKATRGTAPSYPSQLVRVADLPVRRSLRSDRTNRLLVPSVKLSTVGGRAFPVEQPARQCDISPVSVNLPSAFKNISVQASFPDIIIDPR